MRKELQLGEWIEMLGPVTDEREARNMWRIIHREDPGADLSVLAERLLNGEPLDYVLGHSEFYGYRFEVGPAVLIPRPETEELVELILREHTSDRSLRVLDIGSGSGCIAISLALQRPRWSVSALDISSEALAVAQQNASRLAVQVDFERLDILSGEVGGKYDIIVSNPPYIDRNEQAVMSTQTLIHEPEVALFTNGDPLEFYLRIGEIGQTALNKSGQLYLEINEFRVEDTVKLLTGLGYRTQVHHDLQHKPRMIRASLT